MRSAAVRARGAVCCALLLLAAAAGVVAAAHGPAAAFDSRPHHAAGSQRAPVAAVLGSEHAAAGPQHRRRLQSSTSYVSTSCADDGATLNTGALQHIATTLLGDARVAVTGARFTGACQALGVTSLSPAHTFASLFPSALVLSTGDAAAAAGEARAGWNALSTDLQQPGDASIGAYTRDAAVLELELAIAGPEAAAAAGGSGSDGGGDQQLVINYLFGSQEYGAKNPNPDVLSITARPAWPQGAAPSTDLAVLPGGGRIEPPAAVVEDAGAQVYSNSAGRYHTALGGFTQVVPSQGFPVVPGGSYSLRIAVADANHGLIDSVLMLPAGSLRLVAAPTAAHGGPYAVAPHAKLTLNGARSASPNGAILSYVWTIRPYLGNDGSGSSSGGGRQAPAGGDAGSMTVAGPMAVLTAPPAGHYNVTLEVWDAAGGYASATTGLSVDAANVLPWWSSTPGFAAPPAAAAPRPVAALAVNGSRAGAFAAKARSDAPAVLQLDGSASADGRGSRLAFFWTVAQTEPVARQVDVVMGYAEPPRFTHSFEPGVYLVTLEVLGPGGTASRQAVLTVEANRPPTAVAGGPYVAQVGRPVVVDGGASSDPDGDPLAFSWALSRGGAAIGNYTGSALSVTLNKPGTYAVKLAVRDDRGGVATASTEISCVYELPPPPLLPPPPAPLPPPPLAPAARTASIQAPAAAAGAPAHAPNARVSAAALPGLAAQPAALAGAAGGPQQWGYGPAAGLAPAAPAMAGAMGGPAFSYMQPQQQQQVQPQLPAQLQQQQQPPQLQQQALQAAAMQQQQQQQQQMYQALFGSAGPSGGSPAQPQVPGRMVAANAASAALPAQGFSAQGFPMQPLPGQPQLQALGQPQLQALQAPVQPQAQAAQQPQQGTAMCLYSREGGPNANPWAAQVNPTANTFIAPCASSDPAAAAPAAAPTAPAPAAADSPAAPADAAAAATSSSSSNTSAAGAAEEAKSIAVIALPEAFVKAQGAATKVVLDASGSAAAPGRSMVAYHWSVTRRPEGSAVASVDGLRVPVWLAPGEYLAVLQATDTAGQAVEAARGFAVGDVAATLAVVGSPDGFVEQARDAGAASVQLSAAGSAAGPGRSIASYHWQVLRQPDNSSVASAQGPAAAVTLPGGSYTAQLTVLDTSGGSATATRAFAVGGRGSTGATAVITWPPLLVAAAGSAGGGATRVALDASGSAAAANGSSLQQYVWAVVQLPGKQPVANATGRLTAVDLLPGQYQVGLLVVDEAGRTATARKTFAVGAPSSGGGSLNHPPAVKAGLRFSGRAGGSFRITGVADPDGDAVSLSWSLMDPVSGATRTGEGPLVSLQGISPGQHLLLITAQDGRGGEGSGTARVTVTAAGGSGAGSHGQQQQQQQHRKGGEPAAKPRQHQHQRQHQQQQQQGAHAAVAAARASSSPGAFGWPSLVLPQGAMLEVDAAAFFHAAPPDAQPPSYFWQLQQRATGQQVATVYGRSGRFELSELGTFDVRLEAAAADGRRSSSGSSSSTSSTGTVRVVEPQDGLAALRGGLSGKCGPFKAQQYAPAVLSCPGLGAGGLEPSRLHWAWQLTQAATAGSGSSSSDAATGQGQVQAGAAATFLGLDPGVYRAEVAVGLDGPPNSRNTLLYLATALQVSPVRSLPLSAPQGPVCAGQGVALEAPALALPPGAPPPAYTWQVAHMPAAGQRGAGAMQGSGRAFGFTAQPGRYEALLVVQMAGGQRVKGRASVVAAPCIACREDVVELALPPGSCRVSSGQARQALHGPLPPGLQVRWGGEAPLAPGLHDVTVLAGLPGAGGAAAAAAGGDSSRGEAHEASWQLASSCRARVEVRDTEAPRVEPLREGGVCLAPANGLWACWSAQELVNITDNCQGAGAAQQLAFRVSCSRGLSSCRVTPDGRACVRAGAPGQVVELSVTARDGAGNVAEPAEVLVRVAAGGRGRRGGGQQGCQRPDLVLPASAQEAPRHAGERAPDAPAAQAARARLVSAAGRRRSGGAGTSGAANGVIAAEAADGDLAAADADAGAQAQAEAQAEDGALQPGAEYDD